MRFVPVKRAKQQAALMLHRTRDLLIRQRTQLIHALRAHLAEFGLVAERGREVVVELAAIVTDDSNSRDLPMALKQALQALLDQFAATCRDIGGSVTHQTNRPANVETRLRYKKIANLQITTY
jgi:transposase